VLARFGRLGLAVRIQTATPLSPPEPGTGTVYVGPPYANGLWAVSWQGPGSRFSEAWGSEAAVVAWALAQPAQKRLICRKPIGSEDGVVYTELVG
jgi:hypothetical protein